MLIRLFDVPQKWHIAEKLTPWFQNLKAFFILAVLKTVYAFPDTNILFLGFSTQYFDLRVPIQKYLEFTIATCYVYFFHCYGPATPAGCMHVIAVSFPLFIRDINSISFAQTHSIMHYIKVQTSLYQSCILQENKFVISENSLQKLFPPLYILQDYFSLRYNWYLIISMFVILTYECIAAVLIINFVPLPASVPLMLQPVIAGYYILKMTNAATKSTSLLSPSSFHEAWCWLEPYLNGKNLHVAANWWVELLRWRAATIRMSYSVVLIP